MRCLSSKPGGRPIFSRWKTIPKAAWLEAALGSAQLIVILLLALAACLYAVTYVRGGYDDSTYHVPIAVEIAQHLNPYYVDAGQAPFIAMWFPAASEAFVGLLAATTGSINSTNLSGGLVYCLILLLTFKFAGLWVSTWWERLTAVALVGGIPLLLGQTLAFYVDIHLALAVCLSLYLLCRSLLSGQADYAYYALGAAALAAGIKYFGALYSLILFPAAGFCLYRAKTRRPSGLALGMLAGSLLFVSGWYVRNWMLKGNPVYPFAAPSLARPLLALNNVPYQALESFKPGHHGLVKLPHPFWPSHFIRHEYTPDIRDDGFGGAFVLAEGFFGLSLLSIGKMPAKKRQAWLFLLLTTTLLVLTSPFQFSKPRYVLFLPVILGVSSAALQSALSQTQAPGPGGPPGAPGSPRLGSWLDNGYAARLAISLGVLVFTAWYAYANLIDAPTQRTSLNATVINLLHHNPMSVVTFDYVQSGNLRIGYLGGQQMFVSALYDARLSNTLIPLHYKNQGRYYWREFSTPAEFVAHVQSLQLDYIHIFDARTPGADLLLERFPQIVRTGPAN